ncbi:hypothetical protein [Accumulibacter sp.]|uniref:phage tail terminator protein n=1 Tax=Accumulibacter sp. TaxID=2053492 RepID=UPI002879B37C|nr:hypothetical protein [Accumulibacter sp.]MDS4056438.1 hypothetical protein [Accumulibacter sp.]HMW55131.1 hypothetical protein [Accumulibacter sp.]HMW79196.1 hypothetical protein [Accumulibacter sp.]
MLRLEEPLIDWLKGVPGLLGVYSTADLGDFEKAGKPAPCVAVVYDGYAVVEARRTSRAVRIETRWLVILVVRHAARAAGAPARSPAAEDLIEELLQRLLAWTPPDGFTPLELATPPAPVFQAGASFYPLAVTTQSVIEPAR